MKLVPLSKPHLELLRLWRNDNRHCFLDSHSVSKPAQVCWFHDYRNLKRDRLYLISQKHRFVGAIGIKYLDREKPEIGPYLLADLQTARQGIMSQALKLLIKLHPAVIYTLTVLKSNPVALKFAQKNGFTIIGENSASYFLEKLGPLHDHFIPLLQPSYSNQEFGAIKKVLKSGWWGVGPVTQELENEFAASFGIPHAVAVNSATAALHLAVHMLKRRYPKKTNLIVPALTFVSTAAVGIYENLEIRFADINEHTLCLDPVDVSKKADKNTLAVIPVHYAGYLCPPPAVHCPLIEDCAHAAGTPGAGLTGIMACWSFHPVKNLASGDGGMLTTADLDLAQEARRLRWLGINADTWSRASHSYNWEYDIPSLGYKYHLNDIQSALVLTQLRRLPALNKKRAQLAARYNKKLARLPLTLPPLSGSWHLYVIRLDLKLRSLFINYLRAHHISVGVHYKPLHHYPIFKWHQALPVTDRVWQTLVDLPLFPGLTLREQDYIITVIHAFFQKHQT